MFQDGIWSICLNVVVVQEFKEEEKRIQKEKNGKEGNKKSSHQILRSAM